MEAQSAQQAVFVKSCLAGGMAGHSELFSHATKVRGPTLSSTAAEAVQMLNAVGFQGTNFGKAAAVCELLAKGRPVGVSILQTIANTEAELTAQGKTEEEVTDAISELKKTLPPVTFLGVISTLFGTGVRDSITFLCKHALIDVMVVSGGGLEHDLRRACGCEYRTVESNNSQRGGMGGDGKTSTPSSSSSSSDQNTLGRFGNVAYEKFSNARFNTTMRSIIAAIRSECEAKKKHQLATDKELLSTGGPKRGERGVLDGLIPSWILTPSEFWQRVGELLPQYLTSDGDEGEKGQGASSSSSSSSSPPAYESSVLYWAARNNIPIFCPSISDGDIMRFIFEEEDVFGDVEKKATASPSSSASSTSAMPWPTRFCKTNANRTANAAAAAAADESSLFPLQLDLVKDIYTLNRIAMKAHHTGMLILGGGVVKHHICNANLFRNGAEHAVYINNAQEYDGSDGGARPDEAVSWGKIRSTAHPVKIYAEISLVFPLLVSCIYAEHVYQSSK